MISAERDISRKVEQFAASPNSFIDFIGANRELFNNFSYFNSELRHEIAGWRQSVSVTQLIDEGFSAFREVYIKLGFTPPKAKDRLRRGILELSDKNEGERVIHEFVAEIIRNHRKRIPYNNYEAIKKWEAGLCEFSQAFEEARRPIMEGIRETRKDLLRDFGTYLSADYQHFFDFASFVLGPEYIQSREEIRPFLVSIGEDDAKARKAGTQSLLDRIKTDWIEKLKVEPTQWMIEQFLDSTTPRNEIPQIKSIEQKGKQIIIEADPGFTEFLRFCVAIVRKLRPDLISADVDDLDSAQIASLLPPIWQWPKVLRDPYAQVVNRIFNNAFSSIRGGLEHYASKNHASSPEVVVFPGSQLAQKPDKQVVYDNHLTKEGKSEEKENICSVGIVRKGVGVNGKVQLFSDKELYSYVRKQARRIGKNTTAIIKDIQAMIIDLQKNKPYGLGIKKLTHRHVVVEQQRLALRSLDPRRRPTLALSDPNTHALRVVFTVYHPDDAEQAVILLDGVYTHDEYERDSGMP